MLRLIARHSNDSESPYVSVSPEASSQFTSVFGSLCDAFIPRCTVLTYCRYGHLCTFLEELGSAPDVHWKQSLVVQSCLTFCAHVDGHAPVGQACELLTTSLYKGEYLGRRLGIISATVVAGMNKALIGVQSAAAAAADVAVAVAYGSEPPSTTEAWESTVFIDSFEYGFREKLKQGQTATAAGHGLTKKTATSGGGLTAEQLEGIGLGMLLNDDALQRIVAQLALDHREDEGRGSAGTVPNI